MRKCNIYLIGLIFCVGCYQTKFNKKFPNKHDSFKNSDDSLLLFSNLAYYETGKDTVKFLSKFFESNLCNPGNTRHPKYRNYLQKVNKIEGELKPFLIEKLSEYERSKESESCPRIGSLLMNIGKKENLSKCTFEMIPLYRLTYNVVERKREDLNFLKYFNLDTSSIYFKISFNSKVISIVKYQYQRPKSFFRVPCFFEQDSLAINIVKSKYKNAILLNKFFDNKGDKQYNFGFYEQSNIFSIYCNYGDQITKYPNLLREITTHYQDCEFKSLQELYLKPSSSGSCALAKIIKEAYDLKLTEVN